MDNLEQGKEAASGAVATTVEKHKSNFRAQHGTFLDKPSQNITRWLEKAEIYQKAHMIPSLEMASIVIHCIKGEPAVKVQRIWTYKELITNTLITSKNKHYKRLWNIQNSNQEWTQKQK